MANRKRNIQMKFYVTEDEKRLIDEKMSQLPTRRYGAYLRKMAIDGYIIYTDTADISAPLVPKGFIRCSRFRLVFSKTPALAHWLGQSGEARRLPRQSCSLLPAQCFQRPRPGR